MTAPLNVPLVTNSTIVGPVAWPGGTGVLVGVASAWNSAVYTLNYLGPDGATYIALSTTISANGVGTAFTLPAGTIKVTLASGPPTAGYVNAQIIPTNLN
jgi:hypothetical protein